MSSVIDSWAQGSPVGSLAERQRFVKVHMADPDHVVEVLLRLVRGGATTLSQASATVSSSNVSGPLLSTATQGSTRISQQTHVSLAVLAMFRMTVDYAKQAKGDAGKLEAEEHIAEIIRCLPSHLIFKSLDGMFKEWKVERKGK